MRPLHMKVRDIAIRSRDKIHKEKFEADIVNKGRQEIFQQLKESTDGRQG